MKHRAVHITGWLAAYLCGYISLFSDYVDLLSPDEDDISPTPPPFSPISLQLGK